MHHAVLQQSKESFFRLRNQGADESKEDKYGNCPIDYLDEESPRYDTLLLQFVRRLALLLTDEERIVCL